MIHALTLLLLLVLGAGATVLLASAPLAGAERALPSLRHLRSLAIAGLLAALATHGSILLRREALAERVEQESRSGGNPLRAEARAAQPPGALLDRTGLPDIAFARYVADGGRAVRRTRSNVRALGGDYLALETLFSESLRVPSRAAGRTHPHPAGQDVRLSLHGGAMDSAAAWLSASGHRGVVVAQDVRTGEFLVLAGSDNGGRAPLALREALVPGSEWKLITAAAHLELGGTVRPGRCPAHLQVGAYRVRNFGGASYRALTVPTGALARSCNTAFAALGLELRRTHGDSAVAAALRRFGVSVRPPAPGGACAPARPGPPPDVWSGRMPVLARSRLAVLPAAICLGPELPDAQLAMTSFGQGPVTLSPLWLAGFVSAIAADGVYHHPTLLFGDTTSTFRIMRSETARVLRQGMREAALYGTLEDAAREVERNGRIRLAGKTGTAEVEGRADDGWFTGFAIDPRGEIRHVVVVYLEAGGPGGGLPARIGARLLDFLALTDA